MNHEDFGRAHDIPLGSHRQFGIVMAVAIPLIFVIFAGLRSHWWIGGGIGFAFALLAWLKPEWLAPLNRLWFKFGLLLGRIVSPIVMGLIFFLIVTPIAVFRRARGLSSMPLEFDDDASSYWIERDPPGPEPEHISRQF